MRGAVWGPSMLLNNIFDELSYLAVSMHYILEIIILRKWTSFGSLSSKWDIWRRSFAKIQNLNVQSRFLYVEIYDKIYEQNVRLFILRVIGLTKETLLKFVNQDNKLKL